MPHYPINTRLPNNNTPHLCHTTLSIPYCPTTIPPIYATLPYQYQTAQQQYPPSMPHYPINTILPNNHTPHLCHTTLSIPDCPTTIPHLCHTTLSIPDCPITIPSSMPHYPINTRLPNNHTLVYATLPYQYQTAQ